MDKTLQTAKAPQGYTRITRFHDGLWVGFTEYREVEDAIKAIVTRQAQGYELIYDGAEIVSPVSTYNPKPRRQKRKPEWMTAA